MIKFIKSNPNTQSTGFNQYGKVKSFRTLKDMYAERDKQSSN